MARVLKASERGVITDRAIFVRFIVLLSIAVLITGTWAWWHFVYSNPRRVFWKAVDNALRVTSVSKQNVQTGSTQSGDQRTQTFVQGDQIVIGREAISASGLGGFDVVRNEIGTPRADYISYSSIKTSEKNAAGKALDYKNALGIWAKSEAPNQKTDGQLYLQAVLGVVPFGNLSAQQRKELIGLMHSSKVYDVDYGSVAQAIKDRRPTYTYTVRVDAEAYIAMLKKYSSMVGLNNLEQTNPSDFKTTSPLAFKFSIDVWSRQVKSVAYADGREDRYESFGVRLPTAKVPTNTVTAEELQKRIESAQ